MVSSASPTSVQRGAVVDLQLKIKNTSDRTCSRNVGADLQEIFIKSGAEKIWSSDTCGKVQGSDVQSFTPNFERSYQVPLERAGHQPLRRAAGRRAVPADRVVPGVRPGRHEAQRRR